MFEYIASVYGTDAMMLAYIAFIVPLVAGLVWFVNRHK